MDRLRDLVARIHGDEAGDLPVGPILLIGLIVIPLVILLVAFGDEIVGFFSTQADKLREKSDGVTTDF